MHCKTEIKTTTTITLTNAEVVDMLRRDGTKVPDDATIAVGVVNIQWAETIEGAAPDAAVEEERARVDKVIGKWIKDERHTDKRSVLHALRYTLNARNGTEPHVLSHPEDIEAATAKERAAVVAHLRDSAERYTNGGNGAESKACEGEADEIDRGDHINTKGIDDEG